ncbi:MAG: hypothetical protein IPM98_02210 [Lewinellaceae bacterium]|nr:hypothetical protein [Lewinellaceae bacterium]
MKQILLISFLLAFGSSLTAQQTIYVKSDAAGANNGASWQNAFPTLSAALTVAVPGDQVWVSAGTYKPAAANAPLTVQAGWLFMADSTVPKPCFRPETRRPT